MTALLQTLNHKLSIALTEWQKTEPQDLSTSAKDSNINKELSTQCAGTSWEATEIML